MAVNKTAKKKAVGKEEEKKYTWVDLNHGSSGMALSTMSGCLKDIKKQLEYNASYDGDAGTLVIVEAVSVVRNKTDETIKSLPVVEI